MPPAKKETNIINALFSGLPTTSTFN
ncbi:uncharacterized protein METZ01_LOCUS223938, partial [marine metagenome]